MDGEGPAGDDPSSSAGTTPPSVIASPEKETALVTAAPEQETAPATTAPEQETRPTDEAALPPDREDEADPAPRTTGSPSPRGSHPTSPDHPASPDHEDTTPFPLEHDRPDESGTEYHRHHRSLPEHLRRGGLTVAALVAAAAVGLTVPRLLDWVSLRLSSPVAVTVIDPMHVWQPDFTPMYVRPGIMSLEQVRTWPVSWVPGDGIAVEDQRVRVAVSNQRADAVTIVDLRVEVDTTSQQAAEGTLFAISHVQGVPGTQDIQAIVDLDEATPVVRSAADTEVEGEPTLLSGTAFTLAPGQTRVLSVTAHLEKGTKEWRLAVDLLADGKRRIIRAPRDEPPFRISARRPQYEAGFRGELDGPTPGWSPLEDCQLVDSGKHCSGEVGAP